MLRSEGLLSTDLRDGYAQRSVNGQTQRVDENGRASVLREMQIQRWERGE